MKRIVALIFAAITAFAFASCGEPVGYEPEIPQEWHEEAEKEKNDPNTEIVRTTSFDGIWQETSTGKYYYFYNGHIFEIEKPSSDEEVSLWGTVVIIQNVLKEKAEENESKIGYEPGEEFKIAINSAYTDVVDPKLVVVEDGKVKVVLPEGEELVYKFVEAVEDWPAGYLM